MKRLAEVLPAVVEPLALEECDPFARELDRLLLGLRQLADTPDPFQAVPGSGADPDRWRCRCPLHPEAGFALTLTESAPGGRVSLRCGVGCPSEVIREVLAPNPERAERAEAVARALLWARAYARRRAA